MKIFFWGILMLCSMALSAQTDTVNISAIIGGKAADQDTDKRLAVGGQLPDFTANDPDGKKISLSDFKGKYVLVDFWASWCIPCRNEFPFLKKAYSKYKDKNFEIIGYSIDSEASVWVSAIENDDTPWVQVSHLLGYKDPVAVNYQINGVPANWLIAPDGKVIARNLRGEEVGKVLAKFIK